MAKARKDQHGIVVLPPGTRGRINDDNLTRWLSRGRVTIAGSRAEMLLRVLDRLGEPRPDGGLAALRFWGQTGGRSDAWIAAADPMHLETRLHSLRVGALSPAELPESELRRLFDHLRATLGSDSGLAFALLGRRGYLRGQGCIETAPMSASVLEGLSPDEFIPSGRAAAGYHQLLGEIQMALHEHELNQERSAAGLPVINSLWLWGGGIAPEPAERPLPALFANDPVFRGYWLSCAENVANWDGDFGHIRKNAPSAFVAVMPESSAEVSAPALKDCFDQLRQMLVRGVVNSLTLLFRDGLSVEISRRDVFRFWRSPSPLLRKATDDD